VRGTGHREGAATLCPFEKKEDFFFELRRVHSLSRNVRDVVAVHSSLWPEDHNERGILNLNVLAGGRAAVQIVERSEGISE